MAVLSKLTRHASAGLLRLLSRRHEFDGLLIRVLSAPGTGRENALKVEAALKLITRVAPFRMQRIRREVKAIWVAPLASGLAEWQDRQRICFLNDTHVGSREVTPSHLAATLIHEATHARIFRAGISYEASRRAAIEGICLREEIRFARRLPDGEEIIRRAEANLSRPAGDWSDASMDERDREGLKASGCPPWMINGLWPDKKGRE